MIIVNLDFRKIDQSRLKKVTRSNGEQASFGDLILIENKNGTDDRGNDGFVKQGVSKEDRAAGVEMPIIGNYKIVGQKPAARQAPPPARRPAPQRPPQDPDLDQPEDDIPF